MTKAHANLERPFQQGYLAGLALLVGCCVLLVAFIGGTVWILA